MHCGNGFVRMEDDNDRKILNISDIFLKRHNIFFAFSVSNVRGKLLRLHARKNASRLGFFFKIEANFRLKIA